MIDEWWVRKNFEENIRSLTEAIFRRLPEGAEENHKK
jgi:hypothetical protein